MRNLKRNETLFYYALYNGKAPITDEYGNRTGEYQPTYSDFVKMKGNISSAKGNSQAEQFGNDIEYDKVIVIDDVNCPIDENSVLCIDIAPNESGIYDYVVTRVSKTLNVVAYAVSKVK